MYGCPRPFCELLPRLYRRAVLLVGDGSAEDAAHEVYLKLAAHPLRVLDHPQPYAYVIATLVSVVRDERRRLKRPWLLDQVGPDVMEITRRIKDALDPHHLLNPGVIV